MPFDGQLISDIRVNTISDRAATMSPNDMMAHMVLEAKVSRANATHVAVQDGDWGSASTWDSGTVPGAGAIVHIPFGYVVTYAETTAPRLSDIGVYGTLTFSTAPGLAIVMLVETIYIGRTGTVTIGTGFGDRVPETSSITITISDRHYATDANASTPIDPVSDYWRFGRGIVCMGQFTIFGAVRKRHLKTADNSAPMTGDTSLTLAEDPGNWQVGDTIAITGTQCELVNGVSTIFDEFRTITGVSGTTISWSGALVHDHDHQNGAVTRTDLQPSIANTTCNVIVQSENTSAQRRGHIMIMHDGLSDVWDLKCLNLGRTDILGEPGNILSGGQFERFDVTSDAVVTEATGTGDVNSKGRYAFHFHFNGFNREKAPNLHNSVIDGSPGWGVVHHGCEAEIFDNVVFNWAGAGMVGETGDETGPWVRNLVFGCNNGGAASYAPVKLIDSLKRGKSGDFARHGVAYYFRGRAIQTLDNVAASSYTGYAFFHRDVGEANNLSPIATLDRNNIDLKNLSPVAFLGVDEIAASKYPIAHFTRNEAYGTHQGFSVTKPQPTQAHGIMTQLKDFKCWASLTGIHIEYVAKYILLEPDLVATAFSGAGYFSNLSTEVGGITMTGQQMQMTISGGTIEGFNRGIRLNGNDNAAISTGNDQCSLADPRFIVDRATYINCTSDLVLEEFNEQAQTKDTSEVTVIYTDGSPPTLIGEPIISNDFILYDWDGNTSSPGYANIASVTYEDSVGPGRLASLPYDDLELEPSTARANSLQQYGEKYGYWTFGADNIMLFDQYFSDSLTARPVRKLFAIRHTGTIPGTWVNNGEFVQNANGPTVADVAVNANAGETTTIDVLASQSHPDGLPLYLTEVREGATFFSPASARAVVDYNRGTIEYTPHFGFTGSDEMYVWVTDRRGNYETIKVDITVS